MMEKKIERKQSDFEKVIPTAWMVAYRRTFSDIPFSQEIFDKLEEIRKRSKQIEIPQDLKRSDFAPQFEARHKLIDKLILKTGSSQILELASGFSSRGLSMAKENRFNYVEIDLPSVITQKKQIITEIAKEGSFDVPPNLHFNEGNVLDLGNLEKATENFDQSKPITIINEGLLRYFNFQEKTKVAQNIHALLKKFGGTWITSDISLKKLYEKENASMKDHVKKITKMTGKNIVENRFENEEQAIEFFEGLGFSIERHSFMEAKEDLVSPLKLKLPEEQVKYLLEDAVVFVMKAV